MLTTAYMGLQLRNPPVASPSPLSYTFDGIQRLAAGGVGAIVLYSLFEEQLREEAARNARLVDGPSESFPEALDFVPAKEGVTKEAVNAAMKAASESGPLKGILGYNTEPLVSIDFNHNPMSSTFDATQTQVVDGGLVRVLSWYDNEWGFSNRMSDTAALFGSL